VRVAPAACPCARAPRQPGDRGGSAPCVRAPAPGRARSSVLGHSLGFHASIAAQRSSIFFGALGAWRGAASYCRIITRLLPFALLLPVCHCHGRALCALGARPWAYVLPGATGNWRWHCALPGTGTVS
jgi:hypothetical protein